MSNPLDDFVKKFEPISLLDYINYTNVFNPTTNQSLFDHRLVKSSSRHSSSFGPHCHVLYSEINSFRQFLADVTQDHFVAVLDSTFNLKMLASSFYLEITSLEDLLLAASSLPENLQHANGKVAIIIDNLSMFDWLDLDWSNLNLYIRRINRIIHPTMLLTASFHKRLEANEIDLNKLNNSIYRDYILPSTYNTGDSPKATLQQNSQLLPLASMINDVIIL